MAPTTNDLKPNTAESRLEEAHRLIRALVRRCGGDVKLSFRSLMERPDEQLEVKRFDDPFAVMLRLVKRPARRAMLRLVPS